MPDSGSSNADPRPADGRGRRALGAPVCAIPGLTGDSFTGFSGPATPRRCRNDSIVEVEESPPGDLALDAAKDCFHSGIRGHFGAHEATIDGLRVRRDPVGQAWRLLLEAQRWFAVGAAGERFPVTAADLEGWVNADGEARRVAALVCAHAVRHAVLAFDATALERVLAVHQLLPADPEADLVYRVSSLWGDLVGKRVRAAPDESMEADARALGWPDLVVETVAQRALACAQLGELELATGLARRASRMARTEGLPQPEYMANAVLARVRRLSGKPHLAARILVSLLRVAPAGWRSFMQWELALAGGGDRGGAPAARIRQLVTRTASGDLAGAEAELQGALLETEGSLLRDEVEDLAVLLGVRPTVTGSDATRDWVLGDRDGTAPHGLHGVCAAHPDRALREEPVWVVASPGSPGRRVLSPALGLVHPVEMLWPGKRRRARTDGALSSLVLAGSPVEELSFFERLYGFPYQPALHHGARDTLYYRMRERLAGVGEFNRDAGQVAVGLSSAVAIPDSRCSPPPEHSLLAVLAQRGDTSVRDAAEALQIPLRTAQHALKALAAEGICRAERQGRELRYRLEDTTYSEPTTTGAMGR